MYFVATCMMAAKKGVTSAGILNTIDSKALEGFKQTRKARLMKRSPAMRPPGVLRHPDQQPGGCQGQ
jgi:hypothetical protein